MIYFIIVPLCHWMMAGDVATGRGYICNLQSSSSAWLAWSAQADSLNSSTSLSLLAVVSLKLSLSTWMSSNCWLGSSLQLLKQGQPVQPWCCGDPFLRFLGPYCLFVCLFYGWNTHDVCTGCLAVHLLEFILADTWWIARGLIYWSVFLPDNV